jgi:hypothetical protein
MFFVCVRPSELGVVETRNWVGKVKTDEGAEKREKQDLDALLAGGNARLGSGWLL